MNSIEAMIDHLHSRAFYPERHRDCSVTKDTLAVPLWTLAGKYVGFQTYKPNAPKSGSKDPRDNRYFTHITKGEIGVWGLHTFTSETKVLCVVEGIFDAAAIHDLSFPAIAVLSNSPKHLKPWLKSLGCPTLAVCDGDPAGALLADLTDAALHLPDGEDPASVSDRLTLLYRVGRKVFQMSRTTLSERLDSWQSDNDFNPRLRELYIKHDVSWANFSTQYARAARQMNWFVI